MALSNINISVEIDGTTNDGQIVSFSTAGPIQCNGVVENRRAVTDTPVKIWDTDTGDGAYTAIVIINEGANDGEVRVQDPNAFTFSLAIPAGATVVVPWSWDDSLHSYTVWLAAYTSTTTTFKYFVFT